MKVQGSIKAVTVRLPQELWKQLLKAKADGEIKSVHAALIEGAEGLLRYIQTKGKGGRT